MSIISPTFNRCVRAFSVLRPYYANQLNSETMQWSGRVSPTEYSSPISPWRSWRWHPRRMESFQFPYRIQLRTLPLRWGTEFCWPDRQGSWHLGCNSRRVWWGCPMEELKGTLFDHWCYKTQWVALENLHHPVSRPASSRPSPEVDDTDVWALHTGLTSSPSSPTRNHWVQGQDWFISVPPVW
jgi:hypothetical protein